MERPVLHPGELRVAGPHDLTIVDEATGLETDVPTLRWEDRGISPLAVIVFRGDWRMRDAFGATARFAAQFAFGPAASSYPNSEE